MSDRLGRAIAVARDRGYDALLIGVGPDLRYLTGYEAMPLERLTMLVAPTAGDPFLIVPRLERAAAVAGLAVDLEIRPWGESGADGLPADAYAIVCAALPDGSARLAVSDRLWASHLLHLQAALPRAAFEPASGVMSTLRMVKDDAEIDLLRRAAQAADRVIAHIARGRLVGRTQADVAAEVRERLISEGHEAAEFAIVASGPDSASPHHDPSDRVIAAGEPIVLDIGGRLDGYGSDITRTVWVTGGHRDKRPDEEFLEIHALVGRANAAATAAATIGTPCERVDLVARSIIDDAGYGDRFIHRTGHGIGLDAHEDPYIVAGNSLPLAPGMTFSIEPGIYLEGRYGVRIEDIVVCTGAGPVSLNAAPRDLLVVDG